MDRLIGGLGEVKAELVAVGRHLETQNGSIQKHFKDDLEWQQTHSIEHNVKALAIARDEGRAEGRASLRKSDVALITVLMAVVSAVVAVVSKFT